MSMNPEPSEMKPLPWEVRRNPNPRFAGMSSIWIGPSCLIPWILPDAYADTIVESVNRAPHLLAFESNATELLREIRDGEVNAEDEADKFLRDHKLSELSKICCKVEQLTNELGRLHEENEALKREREELRQRCADLEEALNASMVALDDWLHVHAPDCCGEDYVKETLARIDENGATIAYIAHTQERNRKALTQKEQA